MKDKKTIIIITILVILVIAILCVVGIATIYLSVDRISKPVTSQGDAFLETLKAEDYNSAYAICSPDFQQKLQSVKHLEGNMEGLTPKKWYYTHTSINGTNGELEGIVTFKNGSKGSFHFLLNQTSDGWRITSSQIFKKQD